MPEAPFVRAGVPSFRFDLEISAIRNTQLETRNMKLETLEKDTRRADQTFSPTCFRLTGYGRISYIYWSKTSLASMSSIEHTREEAVPTFLSSGRWIEEGNSELGIRIYR